VKSLLVSQDVSRDGLNDFFFDLRDESTSGLNQVFITSLSGNLSGGISKLLLRAESEGLEGLNDDGTNNFDDLDFNTRSVGT
jgi:hypothetical protein